MTGAEGLVIRPAAAADLEPVRLLLRDTWHQVYDPIVGADGVDDITRRWHAPARLAAELDRERSSFLVVLADGHLVGHGFAYERAPATLVVSRLYVRPDAQRRGIGTALLGALVARHKGVRMLRLFVAADNQRGVAFWRRQGFAVAEEGIEEGARVLHMEKHVGDRNACG